MRKSNLFRTLAAVTMLAVVTIGANAQITTSGSANTSKALTKEGIDFVTVGSVMPYQVTPDNYITTHTNAALLHSSFGWSVTGVSGLFTTPAGGAVTVAAGQNGSTSDGAPYNTYLLDSVIAIPWTTVGSQTIHVKEHSRNSISLPSCDGGDSTLTVYVMPKPTAVFIETNTLSNPGAVVIDGTAGDAIVGGCSVAGTTVSFNVTFTGTDLFDLGYQYVFTPFGGAAGVAVPLTANNLGVTSFLTATPAAPNTAAVAGAFTFAVPAASYGKYVFTLTSVTDRISRKTLKLPAQDPGVLNNTIGAAAPILTLYSLPTPKTGTIQHVDNATTVW